MRPVNHTDIAGYHLIERIGSGGMGDVYKAYHNTLNRTAAIKFLHQKDLAERFKNEAYIQSAVNHPNIARLYEYSTSGDTPCIIMEYVEGESLDTYSHKKGKLNSAETENIVLQIASALAYLHEKDILHRDIKPQNFKIQADGKVKMLDFGISKHKFSPKLTQEGFVVGTTEYMSPEQFDQKVEKKSDIWSLGVLAYELLTGYMPFEANNPVTLRSKISKASFTDPKLLVPEISEKLSVIIEKSLRPNPVNRISAAEIKALLSGKNKTIIEEDKDAEKKHKPLFKIPAIKIQISKISVPNISAITKSNLFIPVSILLGAVLIFILLNSIGSGKKQIVLPANDDTVSTNTNPGQTARIKKIIIDVPGIENAILIFPDGTTQTAPYEITGYEGQHIQFKVRAEGYLDESVEFDMQAVQPYTYIVRPTQKQ